LERVKNSGKKCIAWSSINYILCQILITDKIKINRACSALGKTYVYSFLEKSEEKRQLGKPEHRGKVITKIYLKKTEWECVDWIKLAHDGNQWCILAMNFYLPHHVGNSECLLDSQGLSSMDRVS
jgi:hypothetical protein